MAKHNELGSRGENIAKKYLRSKGFRILETNFRAGKGEIDIVAEKNKMIVFVEVKTRSSLLYGKPCEAITPYKQRMLRTTATSYLLHHAAPESSGRFDVVEILMRSDEEYELNHIVNAF